ncbi:uncharacterized protein LOC119028506 isoform X2 [Acanthopagrus latus]|uniref:uncharacterized protein LOC119028506 isoform X2 n=1 Tax=Acanthopagrus latus TaxID=8177 RepID=UPI00187CEA62|nr:uncharacterized protein LOC119028506 isoform X2 [Acanthopagrus latus]
MWNEKKTRTVKLEKHAPAICPMIVGSVPSVSRMRAVRSKEKIKVAAPNSKLPTAACETSENVMRLCVDLMPVLAAAKEPVEEEGARKQETSTKNDPSVSESVEPTQDSHTGSHLDTEPPRSPHFVLPPVTLPKPAPECCDSQRTKRWDTLLPPTSSPEQARTISSNFTIKGFRDEGLVTGQEPDTRPWIDNPLFSKSRSPEFRLPDISLSSLDALLQTVTQKLGRKRTVGAEGPSRRIQPGHLLMAVGEQRLGGRSVGQQISHCTEDVKPANIEALTDTPVWGHGVNRHKSLPPLISSPKQMLVLSMTKKNLLTSSMLR